MLEPGTSIVVITGRNLELSLSETLRGGIMVISAPSRQADAWFKFEMPVDFNHCMPPEQEAGVIETAISQK